ncbi:IS30 family transposase [Anaerotaenia torta]|uniref:IS30 family transposase n=1 Tax=Anaerotaenia torta TaxID=433293 RepID=UPI003D2240D7
MKKQKHLTLDDRTNIQLELGNDSSFKSIGLLLGKDCTTISKEIRAHLLFEKTGSYGKAFNDCIHSIRHDCDLRCVCQRCTTKKRPCWSCGQCTGSCLSYEKYICPRLSKPPYVCNSCANRTRCCLEKAFYKASYAQAQYETLRSESRSGFAISEAELKHLDEVISPLLKNGQSLHHISIFHTDEVMKSERTLYTYVNNGLFSARNIDMPRTIRMRPRKGKAKALKIDKQCKIGRTYEDYKKYLLEHSDVSARQLDTVEGVKGGAVLLTIHFVKQDLQLAFLRSSNDSQSVIDIFEKLYLQMRPDIFIEVFPLFLADNGSEFSNPAAMEYDKQGNPRSKLFYCNANAPYEKPNCENNHEMIRRIIPKGVDIGQYTQDQIDLMMSHINSYARKSLGNKSPYEVFAFQYGEELLKLFNLKKIPTGEIILTPKLLKKKNL